MTRPDPRCTPAPTARRFSHPEEEAAHNRMLDVFVAFRAVSARALKAARRVLADDGLNPPAGVDWRWRPIDKAHYRATLARLRAHEDVRKPFALQRLAEVTTRPIFMKSDHGELLVVDHGRIRPVQAHETEILAAYDRQTAEGRAAVTRMADPWPGEVPDA